MNLDLNDLNEVQKMAVECTQGPCIVSAGAGSGKTRVLTYRVAHLIVNKNTNPSNILAITFTNKAAREMKERLQNMLGVQNCTICTFHALGVKILRECHNYISPRNKFFTIYDETDKRNLIKKIVKDIDSEDKMIDTYISSISKAKNAGIYPSNYVNFYGSYNNSEKIQKVYEEYENQMENNNAYDFDDLLCKTFDLITNIEIVKNYYTEKFKYILVDEFQDTNEIQYKLLKVLQSKYHNIFVVGDEDQSIYSWRGADSKNMMKFIRDFNCKQIFKLEQNYRSTDKILEAANKIISKNTDRLDKNLWTDKKGGVKVDYHFSSNEQYEAEYIAQSIYSLAKYGAKYKDIAILCRMNALTRVIEDKLLGYNIPYKIYGGVKFYDRVEVKNILAYLKCIVNEKDDESFIRIINFPKRKIGEVALKNLKNLSNGKSYMETLNSLSENSKLPSAQLKSFLSVKELFNRLKQKSKEASIVLLVSELLKEIDIESIYDKNKEEDLSRLMNIKELISSIKEFQYQNPNSKLEDYLQAVTLISDIDSYEYEDESVTIATIHAVKGLEFKNTFIIGLEEGIFPLMRNDNESDDEMEEERRLMYVAITRAKERLYLTLAGSRFLHGRRSENTPSRYLEDLGYIKHNDKPIGLDMYDNYGKSGNYNYNDNYYGNNYSNYGSSNLSSSNYYNTSNYYSGNKSNYNNSTSSILGTATIKGGGSDFSYSNNIFTGMNIKNSSNATNNKYTKGQKVKHSKFGEGIVVNFDEKTHCIQIAFSGIGLKKLDSQIAKLEIIE